MYDSIETVLLDKNTIAKRVEEIGEQITKDYEGESVVVVGILKGSAPFMTDLIRQIDLPMDIDFMVVSSYENDKSSGIVKIIKDININAEGKNIIIVEDIVDTGLTMSHLLEIFNIRKCKSVKICSLLSKKDRRECEVNIDYLGFDVPNEFVVGYGLDYNGKYRNLPEIGVLKPSKYQN